MFKPEKDFTYLMPVHFGRGKFDQEAKLPQKTTALAISYETNQKLLENYIPEEFKLIKGEIQVSFYKNTEIDWLYGGQYNVITVSVPVKFDGMNDKIEGSYMLVTWENKTIPILRGRERVGMPKIYADIEDLHILKPHYATTASYEGNTFLNMNFESIKDVTGDELNQIKQPISINAIGWRYIPNIGGPGAELSQFVLYPQDMELETMKMGKCNIKWTEMTPMQNPSQYHIINSLAALPVKKITNAMLSEGRMTLRPFDAKVLE
jgi:acetoacetate decarboxylase